jgi:hypothetical protein
LREHAERHFALSAAADETGNQSCREVLEQQLDRALKSGRDRSKDIADYEAQLACPPIPPALVYLWTIFRRIRQRVGSSGFGSSPISWPDIDAFCRHSRFPLAPWEVEIIEMLDDLQQAKLRGGDRATDKD